MAYIFLDESGDLGFDFTKKGTTQYFVITLLFADHKRPIEKCVRTVHAHLRKRFRRIGGVLHACKEEDVTRQRLLRCLSQKNCAVMTIYLNKKRVYTRLQDEKAVLYNYVTNILLDRIFTKKLVSSDDIHLIASKRETNKFLNENFRSYLRRQMIVNHTRKIAVEIRTPAEEKALQAVDFVSWAIFRKPEWRDDVYYNTIRGKIVEENPLFP